NVRRPLRLAGVRDRGAGGGRARLWHDLRPAARLAGSARLRGAGRRRHLYDRAPLLHGAGSASTDSPFALPLAQLHGHEYLDTPDLRGALRHLLFPDAVPPGNARLPRRRGGPRRYPGLPLFDLPFGSVRRTLGPDWIAN